jgi:molybdopterin converting factor small subunit
MRPLAGDLAVIEQSGDTVGQVLQNLTRQYPQLKPRILAEDGHVQSYVNIFVDDQSIRDLGQLDTPLHADSEVLILAALAGG